VSDSDVITGEAPARYAQALLELAEEAKSLKKVETDLKKLGGLFGKSEDLRRMAASPVFSNEDKISALTALAKKEKIGTLVTQFIGTVAGNRRASEIPAMIAAFNAILAKRRGTQSATVTSAKKLTAAQLSAIKAGLKQSRGRPVDVKTSVDPDLLGGFVVRVGSRLFDSSLKTKLEDLRITLKDV